MAAGSRPPRTRSARLTLVSLLLIPLLSLAALWGLTASITLGNAIRYQHYNAITTTIGPSVTALQETLPVESALTLVWVATKRQPGIFQAELAKARRGTDRYVPEVRSAVLKVRGLITPKAVSLMNTFLAELAGLSRVRAAVDSGAYDTETAFNAYNAINTAEIRYFQNASATSDPLLGVMTQSAIAEARAQDAMGGAVALIEGAIASGGMMPQPERTLFAQVVGQQNMLTGDTFSLADPSLTAVFKQVYNTPTYRKLLAIETQILASPPNRPIPVNGADFQLTAQAIQKNVLANGAKVGVLLSAQSTRLRDSVVTDLILAAGLGLVAVVASIFVMVRFGRRLRVELSDLYKSARQMADERLPRVVERLRRGDDVDVEAESPPLTVGRITETADVAQAFSTVQRTAVEAAVGQASLRKGISQVFANLSLRNQSLLHRQLSMLDTMERATNDPAVLADLFRLDHLTTRMRRHAEGLLILAGTTPGRGWRDPVPLADVLLAAVAEVEDYVRVDVITESADAVAGTAVNDVIHLVAELVENATAFSPPNTRVVVSGDTVGRGFAVEIEDRGLGMAPDADRRRQRAPGQPTRVRPGQQRAARLVRGRPARRQARDQGGAAFLPLRRDHGHRAAPPQDHGVRVRREAPGSHTALSASCRLRPRTARRMKPGSTQPAFGMTGRHHRLSLPGSSPEADPVGGSEVAEAAEEPLTSTAPQLQVPPPPAQDQPPQAGSPMAAAAAWPTSPAEPTGPGPAVNGAAVGGTHLGLPRRVRLASLAPQLRGHPGRAVPGQPAAAGGPFARADQQPDVRAAGRIAARTPRRPGLPRRLPGILRRASGRRSGR